MENSIDFHVSISESLVARLDRVARDRGVRRVHVLREAVADYVTQVEAEQVEREMAAYAEAMADLSAEFIAETDEHTVERLLRETEW